MSITDVHNSNMCSRKIQLKQYILQCISTRKITTLQSNTWPDGWIINHSNYVRFKLQTGTEQSSFMLNISSFSMVVQDNDHWRRYFCHLSLLRCVTSLTEYLLCHFFSLIAIDFLLRIWWRIKKTVTYLVIFSTRHQFAGRSIDLPIRR